MIRRQLDFPFPQHQIKDPIGLGDVEPILLYVLLGEQAWNRLFVSSPLCQADFSLVFKIRREFNIINFLLKGVPPRILYEDFNIQQPLSKMTQAVKLLREKHLLDVR
jgi:hypothetical protein